MNQMAATLNNLNDYLRHRFGKKVYRLAIDAGMTCPNRDGRLGYGGCIFCNGGSGEFAEDGENVTSQLENAKRRIAAKLPADGEALYIAYFQAYTNTYAEVFHLREIFYEAVKFPDVVALSIATRPDCLENEKIQLLSEINDVKPVMVELGFQTANEKTAKYINRGYDNEVFEDAVNRLNEAGIEVIAHIIIGLPGECADDLINTIDYLNRLPIKGIKLQLLHVLKDTKLAEEYEKGNFETLTYEEYEDLLVMAVKRLRKDIVIHRLTGDGPKKYLIAPMWSGNKKKVINAINKRFTNENIIQGESYHVC